MDIKQILKIYKIECKDGLSAHQFYREGRSLFRLAEKPPNRRDEGNKESNSPAQPDTASSLLCSSLLACKAGAGDLTGDIFQLLNDKTIRRGDGILFTEVKERYLRQIDFFVRQNLPIELVFLGFPFKCHNPIETMRRTPDLGELAFLLRLLDINMTLKQIYPPGVNFTVLTEGKVYKDLFGATNEEVERYQVRLAEFVSGLGAGKSIFLVDLAEVYARDSEFERRCQ